MNAKRLPTTPGARRNAVGEADLPRRRAPTIDEVAAAAGVSPTTVSHVLSGHRPVAEGTRQRVLAAVAALDYRPSSLARSLKQSRSFTVAVLVRDLTNPFYPALARGVQSSLHDDGYLNLLVDAGDDPRLIHQFFLDALDRRVDGVILASHGADDVDLSAANRAGVPVVSVGRSVPASWVDVVSADDRRIAADAADHLVARGHAGIAMIAGPSGSVAGRDRLEGFTARLAEIGRGKPPIRLVHADWTTEGGHQAMRQLFAGPERPTAVFCANDLMAIGALHAARELGRTVPGEVAIMGVDDIDAASLVAPALTTVRIPASEIGRQAGRLLLSRMTEAEPGGERRTIIVDHALVIRRST